MTAALVAGCILAGGVAGAWLPVDVGPSDDGRAVAEGPRPAPTTVFDAALSYGPFLIAGALLVLLVAPDGRRLG